MSENSAVTILLECNFTGRNLKSTVSLLLIKDTWLKIRRTFEILIISINQKLLKTLREVLRDQMCLENAVTYSYETILRGDFHVSRLVLSPPGNGF